MIPSKAAIGDEMKKILEIEEDYRLIPAGTKIYDGGHTIIKTIEDTVIAKILLRERPTSEVKKDLAYALTGKINIIVDAIFLTDDGAIGESIERITESLAINAVDFIDFNTLEKIPGELFQESRDKLDQIIPDLKIDGFHDVKIDLEDWNTRKNTCILYAFDKSKGIFTLIVSKRKRIIIDKNSVIIISKRKHVSITDEGVEVTKKSGKCILINSSFPGRIINKISHGIKDIFDSSPCFDVEFD
ncbi:MAG: hypothetical protein ACTSP4_12400 [Candidatus Hodarchaeales archaeon]